jgi:RNA polymerase sigma-70 factor (ECF subfamily)
VESRPPASDAELIARAVDGDEVAFATLVDRHATLAFRAAYLVLRDADRAADATQEAFINVHRALGRFRPDEPFVPWLLAIVGNRARNLRRADWRRLAAWGRAADATAREPALRTAPSPEGDVVAAERRAAVVAAVDSLPQADRLVITCRYFAELGEAETAALLGVARGTVKSRLSRARQRLRMVLEARGLTDV